MPNRVIKDSIWSSPSLAVLSEDAQLHWLRWLLQPDDWGCFNADEDIIKGLVYPKMKKVTVKKVLDLRDIYNQAGLIFLWSENGRVWGFFVSFANHHFCNSTHLDDEGKQSRHKRKTPEPPKKELEQYLNDIKQVLLGKLERVRTFTDKYRNPIPNPSLNPKPNLNPKHIYGEFKNVKLSKDEYKKLIDRFGELDAKEKIENLSLYLSSKGDKYKSHYATILSWAKNDKPKKTKQGNSKTAGNWELLDKIEKEEAERGR